MQFKNPASRRAAFARMNTPNIDKLHGKANEYVADERMSVGEYNAFKHDLKDIGVPDRLVKKVDRAARDEHRHMNEMIDVRTELSRRRQYDKNKYLGKTVEDIQAQGLSNLSEVRDIRDNIIRDRKTSKISKSEAASRMNLLKLVSMRDSDFQIVRKKTRAKSIVDEGIEELKEM